MKKSIKRILSITMALVLILSAVAVLSGCYVTHSAKMKYVEGTYELTTYSGDGNWLEEREMKLIMVIRSDGTGYYGYKDKDTEPFISELRCRFISDPDESGKYQYVEIDFTGDGEYEKLAINARRTNQNLNSQKPKWKPIEWGKAPEIDYQIHVDFTRIDNATDRSVIDEHFVGAPVLPFGIRKYSGTYQFKRIDGGIYPDVESYVPDSSLIYLYVNLDFVNSKGKAYYMLKSDQIAKEVEFELRASNTDSGEILVYLGEREAKMVVGGFYGNQLQISRQGSEYFQLDFIGTISHEMLVAYGENDHFTYLSGMYDGIYEFSGIMYEGEENITSNNDQYVYCYIKINLSEGKAKTFVMLPSEEVHKEQEAELTFEHNADGKLIFLIDQVPYEVSSLSSNGRAILKNEIHSEWDDIYMYLGYMSDEELQGEIEEKYQAYLASKTEE